MPDTLNPSGKGPRIEINCLMLLMRAQGHLEGVPVDDQYRLIEICHDEMLRLRITTEMMPFGRMVPPCVAMIQELRQQYAGKTA